MHGEKEFLRLRNELFRHLVEHARYRSSAIESCCLGGRLVDAYVQNGLGDMNQVLLQGSSHGSGSSPPTANSWGG